MLTSTDGKGCSGWEGWGAGKVDDCVCLCTGMCKWHASHVFLTLLCYAGVGWGEWNKAHVRCLVIGTLFMSYQSLCQDPFYYMTFFDASRGIVCAALSWPTVCVLSAKPRAHLSWSKLRARLHDKESRQFRLQV